MDTAHEPELTTRKAILDAAMRVIAEHKVSGARLRQIARSAGISQGTLHYHFPSKTSLFLGLLDQMERFFRERQVDLDPTDVPPPEKLRLFARQQQQLLAEQPYVEEVFLDFWGLGMVDAPTRAKIQSMYRTWRRDMQTVIEAGLRCGDFGAEYADIAAFLLVSLLEGASLQHLVDPGQIDLEAYFTAVDHTLGLLLRPPASHPPPRRQPYPSDLDEQAWASIQPLLPPDAPGGRPRQIALRQVLDALAYLGHTGLSWRMLPHDFPHWQSVYAYYRQWKKSGLMGRLEEELSRSLGPVEQGKKEELPGWVK
ncbi:MAG TPA: transposase [Anaerolineales bacterium]|nr:transposase [Anaerolineales bacterium]